MNSHIFPHRAGPRDQRESMQRDDVVSFVSEPLEEDTVLLGDIGVTAFVSSDAPSIDVIAKLVIIRPDGYARIVEDGIQRTEITGDGPQKVRVDLGATGIRAGAGDRFGVLLQGTNFPKYARNPHTGEDQWTATEYRPAVWAVHGGPDTPTRLEFTVID